MSSKIYVGNLPYSINDDNLRENFAAYGDVASAKVMMDRDSGRSKGFGFVEMGSSEQAEAAIQGLNGMSVGGRSIIVNISKPKEASSGGYGGGGGGGYRNERSSY
jgi:RNA recognition motif-containing protein